MRQDGAWTGAIDYREERARGLVDHGTAYQPATFRLPLEAGDLVGIRWASACSTPEGCAASTRSGPSLGHRATPPGGPARARERHGRGSGVPAARPGGGPVHRRPTARGSDRDRRLPLVQRLGPRHDDRPAGADPGHRPARGRGGDPALVRAVHSRRPAAQQLPRPARRRARLQHRRCLALVPDRDRPATPRRPATTPLRRRAAAGGSRASWTGAHRRHPLRHRRRPCRRPAAGRRTRRPADLDGCAARRRPS